MKKKLLMPLLTLVLVLTLSIGIAAPAMAWWEANTVVNIQGPIDPVSPGSMVDLIVTEENNGDPAYWISDPWVELEPGSIVLDKSDSPSGDVGNDGILGVGETWEWTVQVQVDADTEFVAIGHGYAQGDPNWDVTWDVFNGDVRAFPNERFALWIYVDGNGGGGEGCTPGFWKNHLDMWAIDPGLNFNSDIFGVGPSITLLEAVNLKGGRWNALNRHAAAAILSVAHCCVDYPYSGDDVIAIVQNAYASGQWKPAKSALSEANELGCEF